MIPIYTSYTFAANERKNLMEDFPLAQFAPRFGWIRAAFNQSAADLNIDVFSGTNLIYQRMIPQVKSTSPILPDDYIAQFPIAPGEQIVLDALEINGNTPVLLWALNFVPA